MKRLNEGQQRLVEDNMRLAIWFAKRHCPAWMNREDCVSDCYVKLCDAAARYVPELGSFASYAIEAMKRWLRLQREPVKPVDPSVIDSHTQTVDPLPAQIDASDLRWRMVRRLDPRTIEVLVRIVGNGESGPDVGADLDISRQMVNVVKERGIKTLRRAYRELMAVA